MYEMKRQRDVKKEKFERGDNFTYTCYELIKEKRVSVVDVTEKESIKVSIGLL